MNSDLNAYYRKLLAFFGPQNWWPAESQFEVMIGAILAQNTSWRNVEKAIRTLKEHDLLSPKIIHGLDQDTLALAIRPSGTYNQKAERVKGLVAWFVEEYDASFERVRAADAERVREQLLSIKGIGKETCDSILLYAFGLPYFVVDTYAWRMLSRHGLVAEETSYEEMQELLHAKLPRDPKLFNEYHALIVELGKRFCKTEPLCERCPLREFMP
jgi:endonuclease-3 related protein